MNPASSSYTARFYGVQSGRVPGVYTDWSEAEKQIKGVTKPKVKAFSTKAEAEAFVGDAPVVAQEQEPSSTAKDAAPKLEAEEVVAAPAPEPSIEALLAASKKRKSTDCEATVRPPPATRAKPVSEKPKSRALSKSSTLTVYTDGSALGNGRTAAQAGVGVWFGDRDERNISEPLAGTRQTNQRAELTAILRALEVCPLDCDVKVISDSSYAIKCVTEWAATWIKNHWITSVGRPVENQDLVEKVLAKMKERKDQGAETKYEWVKGHSGLNDGNAEADKLAVAGAQSGLGIS